MANRLFHCDRRKHRHASIRKRSVSDPTRYPTGRFPQTFGLLIRRQHGNALGLPQGHQPDAKRVRRVAAQQPASRRQSGQFPAQERDVICEVAPAIERCRCMRDGPGLRPGGAQEAMERRVCGFHGRGMSKPQRFIQAERIAPSGRKRQCRYAYSAENSVPISP